MNRPMLFIYQPNMQASADLLNSKLGNKVRLERFDGDGHALFVDDPEKFDWVLEEFLHSLRKEHQ
jgi:non-heme chloroperoxidase